MYDKSPFVWAKYKILDSNLYSNLVGIKFEDSNLIGNPVDLNKYIDLNTFIAVPAITVIYYGYPDYVC